MILTTWMKDKNSILEKIKVHINNSNTIISIKWWIIWISRQWMLVPNKVFHYLLKCSSH